jgi:hypothetical protein
MIVRSTSCFFNQQEASIKFAEMKLKAEAAAAKQQAADAAADSEADSSAADAESAAASAVEEALTVVKAAAEQLPGLQEAPAAAEEEQEGVEEPAAVTVDSVKQVLLAEVAERVAAVEERTKQQQETALQVRNYCNDLVFVRFSCCIF